jgi:hypothetical protein
MQHANVTAAKQFCLGINMTLVTLNNVSIMNDVKGKINNTAQCMSVMMNIAKAYRLCLVYNLSVAVGAELIYGKYMWHTRNQTIPWAASHPVAGNNCTHFKIAENVIFSVTCSFGPILALCQTQ